MTIGVIESQRYRDEVERLKADPIIRRMAREVQDLGLGDQELESWGFISAATTRYDLEGGRNAESIGGPARAIASIVKENR